MGFIEAKCKNCGGDIRLDENLTRGKCEYCGTEFVKSDMIVNNNYTIQNATLVVNEENLTEQMFVNAETYLTTLKDYDKAFNAYQSITQSKVNDYRGWWGMLRSVSHDFTLIENTKQVYEQMCSYADNALKLVPNGEKIALTNRWESYRQQVEEYISSKDQEFAEWVEKLRKQQKKAEQNRIIRRLIVNGISLAANLFIILYGLSKYGTYVIDQGASVLVFVGVALGIDILLTILAELIGSAPECFIYQAITTILVIVYLCYRLTTDTMYQSNLFHLLMFAVGGVFVAAVCIIPTALVFRHLLRKRHSS